jgi:hypothetical protein
MDELSAFERRLAAGLEAYVGPRRSVDADTVAQAAESRSPLPESILHRFTASVAAPRRMARPTAMVAMVALLALALVASVVIVGNQQQRLPAVVERTKHGLIAYAHAGDVFVGDPKTGATTAIVTGPEADSTPIFSPDGTRIAFVRGDPSSEHASVVVVRADGSDERVVMPAGFSRRWVGIAWTPDGASLVANLDAGSLSTPYFDGELALLDASGMDDPRLLTPPLPRGPGGGYFAYTDKAAPMFRPPTGDVILSGTRGDLYLWDRDLVDRTELAVPELASYPNHYFQPWALWWSPDGSMIAFELGWSGPERVEIGSFVMQADGTDVRRLKGVSGALVWSPDGSKIAYQRGCPDPDRQGAIIVIREMASGAERVLDATTVDTKYEGDVSPVPPGKTSGCFGGWIQRPTGRAWDYEGWSWSPDGESIVMLESAGMNPLVVDVRTGEAAELPWEADAAPSWQRVVPPGPG